MSTRTQRNWRARGPGTAAYLECLEERRLFSFGLTDLGSSYFVDTGAQLRFTILKSNADVQSLNYHGVEMQAPFSLTQRRSHYESGLSVGATTVTTQVNAAAGWIEITATDTALGVTHYYMAREGYDNIYMATYAGNPTPPTPGEMRFITYLNKSIFYNSPIASNVSNLPSIEGTDVAGTVGGITRSKYYDALRFIDDSVYGATGWAGFNVGAYMSVGSHEGGSGGPFFKDIDFQTTSASVELYHCPYTGHTQTEAFRPGLQGPYALMFTDGSVPGPVDYSFYEQLNLLGWVPAAGRGSVAGIAGGLPPGASITVGLSNSVAQYWDRADENGAFSITGVKPGVYVETLYKDELPIGTRSVTVVAGATAAGNISSTLATPTAIWRIGEWDGTPRGFLNADRIESMHPTDYRMSPWGSSTVYTVGTSTTERWPLGQFKDVNNNSRVVFSLTAAQAAASLTLRIGITLAFAGGRPFITVNQGQAGSWTSAIPAISTQPNSRGITRGTWRGNNTTFTYSIPAGALKAGTNTIDIFVASGSAGTAFLSPSVTYDAIELLGPNALPTVAVAAAATPNPVTGTQTALGVLGADDAGESTLRYTWTATGPMPVYFSSNGVNDAKNTLATFSSAGTYTLTATITDVGGQTVTSSLQVIVEQTLGSIFLSPNFVTVIQNQSQTFTATAFDQFGYMMATLPSFTWSLLYGNGTIDGNGVFTAVGPGSYDQIIVESGGVLGYANAYLLLPPRNLTAVALGNNQLLVSGEDRSYFYHDASLWGSRDGEAWELLSIQQYVYGGYFSFWTDPLESGLWYFKVTLSVPEGEVTSDVVQAPAVPAPWFGDLPRWQHGQWWHRDDFWKPELGVLNGGAL